MQIKFLKHNRYPRTSSDVVAVPTKGKLAALAILIVMMSFAAPAFAVDAGQVAYVNGTVAAIAPGSIGVLDTSAPAQLAFKTGGSSLAIAYDKIQSVSYKTEVAHHLGVLAAIAVGLVRHRERKHLISITYMDEAGVTQTVLFEVSKEQPEFLVPMLRARVPACGNRSGKCLLWM